MNKMKNYPKVSTLNNLLQIYESSLIFTVQNFSWDYSFALYRDKMNHAWKI